MGIYLRVRESLSIPNSLSIMCEPNKYVRMPIAHLGIYLGVRESYITQASTSEFVTH